MQALAYVKRGDTETGIRIGVSNFVVGLAVVGASLYFGYRYWQEEGLIGTLRFALGV